MPASRATGPVSSMLAPYLESTWGLVTRVIHKVTVIITTSPKWIPRNNVSQCMALRFCIRIGEVANAASGHFTNSRMVN